MTAPQTSAKMANPPELDAPPGEGGRQKPRRLLAGALLSLAIVGVLALGGWGLFASQGATASTAAAVPQGEAAEVPGGLLRVDAMLPEHMAPMQMKKFERSGMSMSSMGMDMPPEGQRRFTVEFSMAAGDGGLTYSADDFRLTGKGVKEAAPLRSQLGGGDLPAGSQTSGSLVFQVPEKASGLVLSFDGGEPVALESEGTEKGANGGSGGHDH